MDDAQLLADPEPGESLAMWEGCSANELAAAWRVPRVSLYQRVGSTNDVARSRARTGAAAGTIVLAEEQTAGRGRVGREWSSPAGLGLWISLIARPNPDQLDAFPLRIGLAVAEALDPWTSDSPVQLKWPNDLILQGRKLGGILCEASWDGARLDYLIVGVGLNLLQAPSDFPPHVRPIAISLRQGGEAVSRFAVAGRVVAAIRHISLDSLVDREADASNWEKRVAGRDALLGREVDVLEPETGKQIARGRAAGISADGSLRLATVSGTISLRSGTIRPSPAVNG